MLLFLSFLGDYNKTFSPNRRGRLFFLLHVHRSHKKGVGLDLLFEGVLIIVIHLDPLLILMSN